MELTDAQQAIMSNFRSERYDYLNKLRWALFLKMGIPLKDRIVFEPGAGIGDQTDWLLSQGVKHIYVNEGRADNLEIIKQRFPDNPRLTLMLGNLEDCLEEPEYRTLSVDLIFLWGVYYHINDSLTEFNIMRSLSKIGRTVVFDYLESPEDRTEFYGYDNPSTSLSRYAIRPTAKTLIAGLQKVWRNAYLPKEQMDWHDPLADGTPRRLAVGSLTKLKYSGLELQAIGH